MAITTVQGDGLDTTAISDNLGYIPPETGYATSTLYEFTVAALGSTLGHNESYVGSSGATIDPFGVPLQDVKHYSMMEPSSAIKTLDLGSGETYVGE